MSELLNLERSGERSLRVAGEIDRWNADRLRAAIRAVFDGSTNATLDMTAVTFIDSFGIDAIVSAVRYLDGSGLLTLRPSHQVAQMLEPAGLMHSHRDLSLRVQLPPSSLDGPGAAHRFSLIVDGSYRAIHRSEVLSRRSRALIVEARAERAMARLLLVDSKRR